MLPMKLRNKLDLLGNVTTILETQNLMDAESNLNREITKLKLANESLFSQRTIMQNNAGSNEELDKFLSRDPSAGNRLPSYTDNPDITRIHASEL